MGQNERVIEEYLLSQQHEAELVKRSLKEADEQEKTNKEQALLTLEQVIEQMGTGWIQFPDLPMRIKLGKYFDDRVSIPVPVDYLKEYTKEENIVTLLNDVMGISLTMQYTVSEDKNVKFEKVKKGMLGQLKGANIYVELLEEGKVDDETAPLYFITYRMPTARGVLFQMLFYAINQKDGRMIIGNYNCFYKDLAIWENVIKATISYFTFE